MSKTTAPKHLTAATQRWFEEVLEAYVMDSHHVRLLTLACEAWDQKEQARAATAKHGLTFEDKGRIKMRPEVLIEQRARTQFAKLVRELNLDLEGPREEYSRPPTNATARPKLHAGA